MNRQSHILIYVLGMLPLILQGGEIPSSSLPLVAIKFHALFQQLREAEQLPKEDPSRKVSFQLSENEVNIYIHYSLTTQPRPGVNAAVLKFFLHNYVSMLVTLDFDEVEHGKPGTIPTMLRPVLSGQKAIWVDFRFGARNGWMTFSVEKSYFQKVWIPAWVTQKVIEAVLARQREKVDASKPIPLPFGLKEAWTGNQLLFGQN